METANQANEESAPKCHSSEMGSCGNDDRLIKGISLACDHPLKAHFPETVLQTSSVQLLGAVAVQSEIEAMIQCSVGRTIKMDLT